MDKNKKSNRIIILIVISFALVFGIAGYKIIVNHNDKAYLVVNQKIKEAAKKCYLDKKCEGNVTLKDLYNYGYINKQIDPVTKEDMNENMCISYDDKEVKFC